VLVRDVYVWPHTDTTPKGVIDLTQVHNVALKGRALRESPGSETSASHGVGKKAVFELETRSGRTYVLAADSSDGARRWVEVLRFALSELGTRAPTVSSPTSCTISTASIVTDQRSEAESFVDGEGGGDKAKSGSVGGDWQLLPGERVLTKQENVLFSHHSLSEGRWGQLHMTLYRFIFSTKVRIVVCVRACVRALH
jgi:hypothetical protein